MIKINNSQHISIVTDTDSPSTTTTYTYLYGAAASAEWFGGSCSGGKTTPINTENNICFINNNRKVIWIIWRNCLKTCRYSYNFVNFLELENMRCSPNDPKPNM